MAAVAHTHRASVGRQRFDLSDPSKTSGGQAAAAATGRREAFNKNPCEEKKIKVKCFLLKLRQHLKVIATTSKQVLQLNRTAQQH